MPAPQRTVLLCLAILSIASAGLALAHGVDGSHPHALAKGGPGNYCRVGTTAKA